jgi:hypothetical protein
MRGSSETKMLNPKLETLNTKQTQMLKTQNSKPYGLGNIRFNCEKSKLAFEFYILDLFRV